MPDYNKIKIVEFGCGTEADIDVLSRLTISEEVAFIALATDTDVLYQITFNGKEVIDGFYRRIILGGMFPSITGIIKPDFKLVRVDIKTILEAVANNEA